MSSLTAQSTKSYISTDVFTSYFRTYSVIEGNGIWGQVTTDPSLCPAGRILRENGKRLFPKANPGVNQLYIGVYDAKTFLNGFIDPNQSVFQVFNGDKPTYLDDNIDYDIDLSGGNPDFGAPVYTRGNLTTTNGNIYLEGQDDGTGGVFLTGGSNAVVYAGYPLGTAPIGNLMAFTIFDAPYVASVSFPNAAALSGYDGSVYATGLIYLENAAGTTSALVAGSSGPILNTLITDPPPYIMLSRFTPGGTLGHLSYTVDISNNTFTVNSSSVTDTSTVNWLLIGDSGENPFFGPLASPAGRAAPAKATDGKKFNPSTFFNLGRRHR